MSRLAIHGRVLLTLLLSMLVIVESAGVARAIGFRTMVACCCGRHAIAKPCACLRCPSKLRVAAAHDHEGHAELRPVGACVPQADEGLLVVIATEVSPPRLAPQLAAGALVFSAPAALHSLDPELTRPPP